MNTKLKLQIRRLIKFCIVGGIGTIIGVYGFYIFINWLKIPDYIHPSWFFEPIPWAIGLSTVLSVVWNFTGNSLWTFKDIAVSHAKTHMSRFVKFCIVSTIASVTGWILLYVFRYWLGISYYIPLLGFPIPWAIGFTTLIGVAWTFSANTLFTFREEKTNK